MESNSFISSIDLHSKTVFLTGVAGFIEGEYKGTVSAGGYSVDSVALNLSDKDQKWPEINEL